MQRKFMLRMNRNLMSQTFAVDHETKETEL